MSSQVAPSRHGDHSGVSGRAWSDRAMDRSAACFHNGAVTAETVDVVVHCPSCDLSVAVVDEPLGDRRRELVQGFIAEHRGCSDSISLRIGGPALAVPVG